MKFKLDENLGDLGKAELQADGHDVSTVSEQDLRGARDETLFRIVGDERRILVTLDLDFAPALRFPPEATAGLVILRCKIRQSPAALLTLIDDLRRHVKTRAIEGALWVIEPGRIRIRSARPVTETREPS